MLLHIELIIIKHAMNYIRSSILSTCPIFMSFGLAVLGSRPTKFWGLS